MYLAAVVTALAAVAIVLIACWRSGSTQHLGDKWIFRIAAGAAPIPTYLLLIVVPLDADLGAHVLEDRVVVALAGLYGLTEAVKDIRDAIQNAKAAKAA